MTKELLVTRSDDDFLQDNQTYNEMMQNSITNQFASVLSKNAQNDTLSDLTKIEHKDISFSLPKGTILNVTDHIILDILTTEFTKLSNKDKNPQIKLGLDEFMEIRGLDSEKTARRQLKHLFDVVNKGTITVVGAGGRDFMNIKMAAANGIVNNVIKFQFTDEYCNAINTKQIMFIPERAFTINSKENPHAYLMIRKIVENKRTNKTNPQADKLRIETLLAAVTSLPTYETIKQSNRNFKKRIIKPFFKDLLKVASLNFCKISITDKAGDPYTLEDFANLDLTWEEFTKAMLVFSDWNGYPIEKLAALDKKHTHKPKKKDQVNQFNQK